MKLQSILFALIFLFPLTSFGMYTDPNSDEARLIMEKGMLTNEELFDFMESHPCELGIKKDCSRPLTAKDLNTLKNLLRNLEVWRKAALEIAMPQTDVFQGHPFEMTLGEEFSVTEATRWIPGTLRKEKYFKVVYNPTSNDALRLAQAVRISSATSLLLFDSFFRLADTLSKATKIRGILEYDMPEEGPILNNTYGMAMDQKLWDSLTVNLKFMAQEQKLRGPRTLGINEAYFEQYVEKSFVAEQLKNDSASFRLRTMIFLNGQLNQTVFYENLNRIVGRISQFFGNTTGRVQTRDGKLKKLSTDPRVMTAMKHQLKPLDILLEKTPMRLTDKFIPGYYGHVAIWLGTPEELSKVEVMHQGKLIPLLNHPTVLPHLEKLSQGKMIVEALRLPGVTMNTLEHFMDIDDFLVLRSESYGPESLGEHLLRTFEQVGKPYDFNFNVETQREIVCSELVYAVYINEAWPTSVSVGRYTISPDHVAWRALDSCFEPILMYKEGVEIKEGKAEALKEALTRPGGISYTPSNTCNLTYGFAY